MTVTYCLVCLACGEEIELEQLVATPDEGPIVCPGCDTPRDDGEAPVPAGSDHVAA